VVPGAAPKGLAKGLCGMNALLHAAFQVAGAVDDGDGDDGDDMLRLDTRPFLAGCHYPCRVQAHASSLPLSTRDACVDARALQRVLSPSLQVPRAIKPRHL
jgi:hypothetical protein